MAYDVFISYPHEDKLIADAICAKLESRRIRCFYALRDIRTGQEWPTVLATAMEASRVVVLVFSANANNSDFVRRELNLAAENRRPIFPFRVADVGPSDRIKLFLVGQNWLDAVTPPLERHIETLADSLTHHFGMPEVPRAKEQGTTSGGTIPAEGNRKQQTSRRRTVLLIATILLALFGIVSTAALVIEQYQTLPGTPLVEPRTDEVKKPDAVFDIIPPRTPISGDR